MNSLPSAVFLDRDGTIIEDAHYLSKPEQVRLLPGAADAIARINAATVPVIVITNQSGIGRGIFTDDDHLRITERLNELLEASTPESMMAPWTLRMGDHVIFTMPRAAVIRAMGINHIIHHRGQLSVFLRLLDIPVPGMYGPSADEK